jgi:hypothetical protein
MGSGMFGAPIRLELEYRIVEGDSFFECHNEDKIISRS